MSFAKLRNDEQLGLGFAVVVHAVLLAALAWQATRPAPFVLPPDRMVVSLAQDVAPVAEAHQISRESQEIPEVSEQVAETPPPPRTPPRTVVNRTAERQQNSRTQQTNQRSAIPEDFLNERQVERSGESSLVPADQIGRRELRSIQNALAEQVAPHWTPPSGADSELLVTILTFDLNEDGSLKGRPQVVSQQGVTDANRAQAGRHAELAIRAVQLAAPFDLPPEYYLAWRRIRTMRMNWDL